MINTETSSTPRPPHPAKAMVLQFPTTQTTHNSSKATHHNNLSMANINHHTINRNSIHHNKVNTALLKPAASSMGKLHTKTLTQPKAMELHPKHQPTTIRIMDSMANQRMVSKTRDSSTPARHRVTSIRSKDLMASLLTMRVIRRPITKLEHPVVRKRVTVA